MVNKKVDLSAQEDLEALAEQLEKMKSDSQLSLVTASGSAGRARAKAKRGGNAFTLVVAFLTVMLAAGIALGVYLVTQRSAPPNLPAQPAVNRPPRQAPTPPPRPTTGNPPPTPALAPPPTPVAATVAVPDVQGIADAKARQQLEALGFVVTAKQGQDANWPAGVVISTLPRAGTSLAKGATIEMTVNAAAPAPPGPGPAAGTPLKNYLGMAGATAQQDLQGQGMLVTVVYESSRLQQPGCVLKTDPPAGTPLLKGARVTLVLAR